MTDAGAACRRRCNVPFFSVTVIVFVPMNGTP